MRDLVTELARAEQRTRKQIADDLHDGVAQDLAASHIKLQLAGKLVRSPRVRGYVADVDAQLTKSLMYMKTLISELSPSVLYEAGLVAALKHLTEQMARAGLDVKVVEDGDAAELPKEEAQLVFQSVRELLFNVVKHADVKQATVSVRWAADGLMISVIDRGKGFDVHEDTKASTSGGKYGLFSISERFEALGGWFSAESSPGKGTNATLFAPIRNIQISSKVEEVFTGPPNMGLAIKQASHMMRVVIADDNSGIRSGLRTLLDGYADMHVVGEACNGEAAVEMAEKIRPDAIIMDISMPKMNGIQATRVIKRNYPDIVVIGLSVHMEEPIKAMMIEAGATTLLSKADRPENLYLALREARAKARSATLPE